MAILGRDNTVAGEPLSPLSREHRDRIALFDTYWDYYRGRHRKALIVKPGQPDDNVTLNYSRRVVNKGLSFLFGSPVTFEIDSADERSDAEQHIDNCWGGTEQKARALLDLGLNGAVTGMAFARIYQPETAAGLPRIASINPSLMDVITSADDIDDIRGYVMTWKAGRGASAVWRRQRFDVQQNGTWVITQEEYNRAGVWQLTGEESWPWQASPMVYCQNLPNPNDIWGISDLEDADINDALNWIMSNINRIIRYHAHPKTIGTGFAAAHLENTSVDQFWTINNADAKVFNLEMQSDLGNAYTFAAALKTAYAQITGVPDLDPQQVNVGALSGFALRILYGDLLDMTNIKRVTYGSMLSAINAALLEIAGFGTEIAVNNVWDDPLPSNETEQAQSLAVDRQNGLSLETYLDRRGYDAAREMERSAGEKAADMTLGDQLLRAFETGQTAIA